MGVARAVRVNMFMFVKRDFEFSAKCVGYAAKGLEARNMCAAFQSRNHRLGHAKPLCDLGLGLTIMLAETEQYPSALGRDSISIIAFACLTDGGH